MLVTDWKKKASGYGEFVKSYLDTTSAGKKAVSVEISDGRKIQCAYTHREFNKVLQTLSEFTEGDEVYWMTRGTDDFSRNRWFYSIAKVEV